MYNDESVFLLHLTRKFLFLWKNIQNNNARTDVGVKGPIMPATVI